MKTLPNSAGCEAKPTTLSRLFKAALFTVLFANTLSATLLVSAGANGSPGAGGDSSQFGNPSVISAFANSGGTAGVSPTPLANNTAQFPHLTGRAEARTNGTLRAAGGNVVASGNIGGGIGTAAITDTILFTGTPTLNIYIDGSLSANGTADAHLRFEIYTPGDGSAEGSPGTLWFSYDAHRDSHFEGQQEVLGSYYSVFDFTRSEGDEGGENIVFGSIPSPFVYTLTLPMFPGVTTPIPLVFSLTARGSAQDTASFGYASFDNTTYIGIAGDYVSSNGYTYAAFPGSPSSVPEPGVAMLAGGGLAVLLIRRLYLKI